MSRGVPCPPRSALRPRANCRGCQRGVRSVLCERSAGRQGFTRRPAAAARTARIPQHRGTPRGPRPPLGGGCAEAERCRRAASRGAPGSLCSFSPPRAPASQGTPCPQARLVPPASLGAAPTAYRVLRKRLPINALDHAVTYSGTLPGVLILRDTPSPFRNPPEFQILLSVTPPSHPRQGFNAGEKQPPPLIPFPPPLPALNLPFCGAVPLPSHRFSCKNVSKVIETGPA